MRIDLSPYDASALELLARGRGQSPDALVRHLIRAEYCAFLQRQASPPAPADPTSPEPQSDEATGRA